MRELTDTNPWCVTFVNTEPHPRWHRAHRDGYLAITGCRDEADATAAAYSMFGDAHGGVRRLEGIGVSDGRRIRPLGELGRISAAAAFRGYLPAGGPFSPIVEWPPMVCVECHALVMDSLDDLARHNAWHRTLLPRAGV